MAEKITATMEMVEIKLNRLKREIIVPSNLTEISMAYWLPKMVVGIPQLPDVRQLT
jgi:hypothetical protein